MTRLLKDTKTGTTTTGTEPTDEPAPGAAPETTAETTAEATTGAVRKNTDEAAPGTTAEAAPESTDESASDDTDEERPGREGSRRVGRSGALVAVAVTALLLGGGWFFHAADQLRSTPSARNLALTDAGATARVGGDVGEGLARVFSYTPDRTDAAERSADHLLAGRAARQYDELFAQVRASLVEQRITLSTQTVRTGVIELDGDSARLLVFLDQTSRRDKGAATSAAAQLTVTARFGGDRWQIVDIKTR
ncbi:MULTISPECIES: hypothetical protein [unclassified Streptomyces]|uniref:hypothetical protein n=1 Tax=unclassified Streptomyces TaxID=2593676 RepID=UPI003821D505